MKFADPVPLEVLVEECPFFPILFVYDPSDYKVWVAVKGEDRIVVSRLFPDMSERLPHAPEDGPDAHTIAACNDPDDDRWPPVYRVKLESVEYAPHGGKR